MYATAANPHGILRPGLFGRVTLAAGTREGAIVVPEVAVDQTADEKFVYRIVPIVTKGQKKYLAEKVIVTTGLRNGAEIEIASGLRADDYVIVVGAQKFAGHPRAYANPVNVSDFPDLEKQLVDVDEIVRKQKEKTEQAEQQLKDAKPEPSEASADEKSEEEDEEYEDEEEDEDDTDEEDTPKSKASGKKTEVAGSAVKTDAQKEPQDKVAPPTPKDKSTDKSESDSKADLGPTEQAPEQKSEQKAETEAAADASTDNETSTEKKTVAV